MLLHQEITQATTHVDILWAWQYSEYFTRHIIYYHNNHKIVTVIFPILHGETEAQRSE